MTRQRNSELDSLIADITVDCYNDDEALTAFEAAFDNDASFPARGTVIGEQVQVISVAMANDRRELLATCEHHGKRYRIALLDIDLHGARPPTPSPPPTGAGTTPDRTRHPQTRRTSEAGLAG